MAGNLNKLTQLAEELFSKGLDSESIRIKLAEKVPAATEAEIEKAVTPTLQSRVEKGKELMIVEPGLVRPTSPELSSETALVPTGRPGKTTFIAGERGISAGEQSRMGPTSVYSENRPLDERFGTSERDTAGIEVAPTAEPGRLSKITRPASLVAGAGAIGLGASGYWGEPAKETPKDKDQKQADMQPAPGPGGRTPPAATPQKEDGIPAAPSQDKKPVKELDDIESVLEEAGKIQAKLGAGKAVPRDQLEKYLNQLEDLKPVAPSSPDTQRFVQARAEAYRAYQEKADRNDWLEVAQNLVGALTNYASARSAMGTPFIGGAVPLKGIDYGARTERAGKEYAMELGQIGAEERAAESKADKEDRLARESLALTRGGLQEKIAAERERIREGEAEKREAGREATGILKDILTNRRYDRANQARLAAETARLTASGQKTATTELDNQIKSLMAEEKAVTTKLKAANNLMSASGKAYDSALAAYATASGVSEEALKEQADKESGFFTTDKSYLKEKIAGQHAQELAAEQQKIQQQIADLRKVRFGSPASPAVPTSAQPASATPPSTPAAKPATVILRNPKTGRTKETVWDETAQNYVRSGQLELVK